MSLSFESGTQLNKEQVLKINREAKTRKQIIELPNTVGLNPELVKQLDDNVIISIKGGLNPNKAKFRGMRYQNRTYYTPKEVVGIISIFREIEKGINPLWPEEAKAMYVYKRLCEYLDVDKSKKDNAREEQICCSLLGLLPQYRRGVCAGFSMIFKEAMDRLGIDCEYQTIKHYHAWNVLKFKSGKKIGLDLTFETAAKKKGECNFYFFGCWDKNEFYSKKTDHDISGENEEIFYDLSVMNREEKNKYIEMISEKPILIKKAHHKSLNETSATFLDDKIAVYEKDGKLRVFKRSDNGITVELKSNVFTRDDGSSFALIPVGKRIDGRGQFLYIDKYKSHYFRGARVISEMTLSEKELNDPSVRNDIANILLTQERINEKIEHFNGYVGAVCKGDKIIDRDFEKYTLGVYR
jgi:hypothetical protein